MKNHEYYSLFTTIIRDFKLKGELTGITCVSTGNINDTYVVSTVINGMEKEYILQRVNHKVFSNPDKVAENVCKVTDHVEKKLRESGYNDIRRRVMRYYRKSDGSYFHITDDGNYWRVLSCVYNAVSIDFADVPHLRAAGIAFGRLSSVKEEYDYLMSMENEATLLCKLSENGLLPHRVVHNDTKCNNVMFDSVTGEHLAVIDLDTVMEGLVAYDFGDAVRFAANPGGEDNEDTSKIYLDLDYYSAFAEGFVPCLIGKVTDKEIETLPDGVLAITLELAARFLTDYLNGDVYFKCKRDKHNLIRTKAQIALAKDVFGKMPELRKRLSAIVEENR